jgi:O-acetyl-ADP-ribose deacetylase (regulator of RNase III)
MDSLQVGPCIIEVVRGDIKRLPVDVKVYAANKSLISGEMFQTGEAVIAAAGEANVKHAIYMACPIWSGGNNKEEELLAECYKNALKLAARQKAESIVFPDLNPDVYRFPRELSAQIALGETVRFLSAAKGHSLKRVFFVSYHHENYACCVKEIGKYKMK